MSLLICPVLVSGSMDASCSGCHPGKKCLGRSRRSPGRCCLSDPLQAPLHDNQEFSFKFKEWQIHGEGKSSILNARINVDWLTFLNYTMAYSMPHRKPHGLAPCFNLSFGGQSPSFFALGSRKLAVACQAEKKHVVYANDHTYSGKQSIYGVICAQRTAMIESKTHLGCT